jgi:hypothetical protein
MHLMFQEVITQLLLVIKPLFIIFVDHNKADSVFDRLQTVADNNIRRQFSSVNSREGLQTTGYHIQRLKYNKKI